jgi:N-acetylglutamate synthase-like GNAT family acetyltransferase
MSTLAVRPALPQDEIFLYELYRAIRGPQFDMTPLNAQQKEHMLRFQFQAQISSYTQQYPNSCYHIVLVDGKPCGRLWVAPATRALHLVDIAIHPNLQKKGVGTVLVQRLQQEAQNLKVPITSMVDRCNPGSLRFHQRLGFTIVREDVLNYFLEWNAAPLVG